MKSFQKFTGIRDGHGNFALKMYWFEMELTTPPHCDECRYWCYDLFLLIPGWWPSLPHIRCVWSVGSWIRHKCKERVIFNKIMFVSWEFSIYSFSGRDVVWLTAHPHSLNLFMTIRLKWGCILCRFTGSEDISSLVRMHSSVLGQSAPTLSTTMVSKTVVWLNSSN